MRNKESTGASSVLLLFPWRLLGAGGWLVAAGMRRGSVLGGFLAAAGGALLYRAMVRPAPDPTDRRPLFARGLAVKKSISVNRAPADCYHFWRNLENLSAFMDHVRSVRVLSPKRSRWVAKSIGGTSIEWDAEIVKDIPGKMIGWRSLPGSPLQTGGSVRFEPRNGSTDVVVSFKYDPPAGSVGTALAELFGDSPSEQISAELMRFKAIMEEQADQPSDPIELASEDSFPASDPPAWTGSRT